LETEGHSANDVGEDCKVAVGDHSIITPELQSEASGGSWWATLPFKGHLSHIAGCWESKCIGTFFKVLFIVRVFTNVLYVFFKDIVG